MGKPENREYRSDVFSMILQEKEYALEVYNALNNSNYDNPDEIEIVTLENGISLSYRNDAAFIIGSIMNIYEHQSKYNPNMPLRSLIYVANIYSEIVKHRDLLSHKLIKIPSPKFVVFYNGAANRPEYEEQRLSDSFMNTDGEINLELVCKVYNINPGNNERILSRSKALNEYTLFVEKIRENIRNGSINPIEEAIEYCIKNHILEEFLRSRRSEVLKSMAIDMTFERREELIRAEEREEGRAEGRERFLIDMVASKVKRNKSIDQIAEELESNVEDIVDIYNETSLHAPDYNVEEICKGLARNN